MTDEVIPPLPVENRVPCKGCGFMQDPEAAPPIREFCTLCDPPKEEA